MRVLRRRRRPDVDVEDRPSAARHGIADEVTEALLGAGRGDEAAFAHLYDLTAATVYGIVRRVVRAPSHAEEITQEVFVEVWRLAPRYDPAKGSARSWVSTIAHRRAVDRIRSEQATRSREERHGRLDAADHDSVVDAVVTQLDHERVRAALASLTDAQRQAVTLAYYRGHTYREVAMLLDIPEGTAKTRIRDGLVKLRDVLGVTG